MQRGGLFGGAKGDPEPVAGAEGDGEEEEAFAIVMHNEERVFDIKEDCTMSEFIAIYEEANEEQKDTHKFIYYINNSKIDVNPEGDERKLTALGHVAGG